MNNHKNHLRSTVVKLYNKTKCPTAILRPLLVAAGKSVGATTSGVVVKVTQARYPRSRGMAYRGWPYIWHLQGRRKKGRDHRKQVIDTRGGWFTISLPGTHPAYDLIGLARQFYKVAQHEWAHIKDYQGDVYYREPRTASGRRIAHDQRPCEQAAYREVMFAKPLNIDDMILDLALYLETH
jgi:hypothetical protein